MILLLALGVPAAALALVYGWAAEYVILRGLELADNQEQPLSTTILLGLAVLSGLLGIWSFYWGIATRALVFFSGLAVLLVVLLRGYFAARVRLHFHQLKSVGLLPALMGLMFLAYAAYFAAASTPTYDTGLYHAQSVRWIEEYPVVPGLANLHHRLGFNSNLFLLAALWGFTGFEWGTYAVPGLLMFVAATAYLLGLVQHARRAPAISGFVALGLLMFLVFMQRAMTWLATPGTDLPVVLIIWSILLLTMQKIETGSLRELDLRAVVLVLLALFGVSIKLSSVPVLVVAVSLMWLVRNALTPRRLATFGLLSAIVFLPWVCRNVVLTGYLVFPFQALDVFQFDWEIPASVVQDAQEMIRAFGRDPSVDPSAAMNLSIGEWLPRWLQTLPVNDLFIVNGMLAGLLLLALFMLFRGRAARQVSRYAPVYLTCAAGAVFWLLQSAAPRFGYGFLVPLFWLVFAPPLEQLFGRIVRENPRWVSVGQLLLIVGLLVLLVQVPPRSWKVYLQARKQYPQAVTHAVEVDGHIILTPATGHQCWYEAFPCTPEMLPGLRLRGSGFQYGFRLELQ